MVNVLKELKEAAESVLKVNEHDLKEECKKLIPTKRLYLEGKVQGIKQIQVLIKRALEK